MNQNDIERARAAKAAYMRAWARKNKEKRKAASLRYWLKKADQAEQEQARRGDGEDG